MQDPETISPETVSVEPADPADLPEDDVPLASVEPGAVEPSDDASDGEPSTAVLDALSAAEPEQAPESGSLSALQTLESFLGKRQRLLLQRRLRARGYYRGPIDGIMGRLTRDAIETFQEDLGDPGTGYLTPAQMEILLNR
ncbi:MAG: peptidoglycan-binding protein [Neomegalonema sp.]|nr:peptidoglycan-binding protein [Neomegalonema sp.]